jgi:serine-type D-Ala-D-Ala carboxypeptidase/endopeptidase
MEWKLVESIDFSEHHKINMNITTISRFVYCALIFFATRFQGAAQNTFTDAEADSIKTFLHDNFDGRKECMVIGLVDESGSKVFSGGKLDNGTSNEVDGDSVFFIGSVSKTFTALLLQEMVDRGEVKLDDPVAKYLPKSVKMPTHGGKEITLLNLATHTAGFPHDPSNMSGRDVKVQFETYTVEKMYAYLSGFKLSRDPGTEFEYSNLGMSLLGHVLSLKAGTDFESLLVNKICRPLHMDNTRIVPTPEMKARLAMGHNESGKSSPPYKLDVYAPAGAVHSTANDLLKYLSAQVGLTPSSLTPSMEKTHVIRYHDSHGNPGLAGTNYFGKIAMPWMQRGGSQPPGMELLGHAGGAGSYHAWVGFDKKQRRGVVVLTTSEKYSVEPTGQLVLRRQPFRENMFENTSEPVGIGAALDLDQPMHILRITKIIPNSPASRAGLSAGLIIQKIDDVPTATKSLPECVNLIRGKAGTKVRLELVASNRSATNTIEITRAKFHVAN